MAKPRCFKQTNVCCWFRYIFAFVQFVFLFLIFFCENLFSLSTFVLTLGCKYYKTQWQWYNQLDMIDSDLIDDFDFNNLSKRKKKNGGQHPAPIALQNINSGSNNYNNNNNNNNDESNNKQDSEATLRVLTQNLWVHYLAPSPCKEKRIEAFINYLTDLKEKNELYHVLILQEIFGIRFGLWIRCPHLIMLVRGLRELGYVYHTKPSGILPYFGQNGGVMIFSLYKMEYNSIEQFYDSDEKMLRKGYAIAIIKINKNLANKSNLKKKEIKTEKNNKNEMKMKNSKSSLFSRKSNKNNATLVGDNTPTITSSNTRGINNIINNSNDTPIAMEMKIPTEEGDDDSSAESDKSNERQTKSKDEIVYTNDETIDNNNNNNNDNNDNNYYYICCGTGHCDPYRVNVILSQINQFANAMSHQFDAFFDENRDLDMIVGGDFNTRNGELQQGLRNTFSKVATKSLNENENDNESGNISNDSDVELNYQFKKNEIKQNGMTNVWEMDLYSKNNNKLSNVTYRSIEITKFKLWMSILSCGLISLPSLNDAKYEYGHCLDHILTNINEKRIVNINVVDTRWKDIFVSDHMGVMIQFTIPYR